jgi:hypothetical protein
MRSPRVYGARSFCASPRARRSWVVRPWARRQSRLGRRRISTKHYTSAESLSCGRLRSCCAKKRLVAGSFWPAVTRLPAAYSPTPTRREESIRGEVSPVRPSQAHPLHAVRLDQSVSPTQVAAQIAYLGVGVAEIDHRVGAGVRPVHRWISEIRCPLSALLALDLEPVRP